MAESMEVMGSRREVDSRMRQAVMLFVSDGAATDLPEYGDSYTGDAANIEARRCVSVTTDPDVVPGLYYHVASFRNFKKKA